MKQREIEIIKLILTDDYTDTNVISQKLNLSTRSIRYAISNIKRELKKYNIELFYVRSCGYYFAKHHQIKVQIILHDLSENNIYLSNHLNRRYYIMGQLLIKKAINIDEISQISFVSSATIIKDLQKINNDYQNQFILTRKKNKVQLENLTFENQLSIFSNLLNIEIDKMINFSTPNLQLLFKEKMNSEVFNQVINLCFNLKYHLNTQVMSKIIWVSYFIIIVKKVEIPINKIDILEVFKQELSEEKQKVIENYFVAAGFYQLQEIESEIYQKSIQFFELLIRNYQIDIDYTSKIFRKYIRRLMEVQMRTTLKINYKISDKERIIRLYPYSFSLVQQQLAFLKIKTNNLDDILYLTVRMQNLMFNSLSAITVLIIYKKNNQIANLYSDLIQQQFSKNLKVVVINKMQLNQLVKNTINIRLIINFTNQNTSIKVPELNLNPNLTISNMNKIEHYLEQLIGENLLLNQIFTQANLKVYLTKPSLKEVVCESAIKLKKNGYIKSSQKMYQACIKREAISSTKIGFETMLVHPLDYYAMENIIYLNIIKQGIDIDGDKVKIILVCCFKKEIDFAISRLFENILKVVENNNNRRILINSESEMDLMINLKRIIKQI